ncbi:MBL fold metallo-hydrolase [Neptunicella sp. SCSIO 80796]|uniref:MBL fold metallo-hydrolase n=1 Tax=Neptunicella plasticusilytica TaxID=3117012 RepID=UPI003A4E33AC
MKVKSLLYAALFCTLGSATEQEDSGVRIVTHKISPNLYVLLGGNGQGSHVGVRIGEQGIILIDSMLEESGHKLLTALRQISDKPVRYLINTHDHFDHSGGNALFAEAGATIIAQQSAHYEQALPLFTFNDKFSMHDRDQNIQLYHVSSHSPSDILVYIKDSNVIFMGDTFANQWYPALFHGGLKGQLEALDLALSIIDDNTIVVPGHGHIDNKDGLLAYRNNCILWVERIMQLYGQNISVENMLQDDKLQLIKADFNQSQHNQDNFDALFGRLVENTVKAEVQLNNQSLP